MAFADQMRAAGYAVESILTALNQAGLEIAARTSRAWCAPATGTNQTASRTVSDAQSEDAVRSLAFTTNTAGQRVLAPEGLYGRRKMLALIRRTLLPEAGFGAVDRAMRSLGLASVVRGKRPRTALGNSGTAVSAKHLILGGYHRCLLYVRLRGKIVGGVRGVGTVRRVPVEFLTDEQAEAYGKFAEEPTRPELE
ncbi:hypothetical protein ACFQ71_40190, partial [Streptomyces sp. NPDC056534]